jgi:glutathione S-transferase
MELVIGNKKYSSWSFRPWLLMRTAGIQFSERLILIRRADSASKIARFSPAGRVPVLKDGRVTVWESLAICEHLAEKFPSKRLWPSDPAARSEARSVAHEMHAGFTALRQNLPCHFLARYRDFKVPGDAWADIDRVLGIWKAARRKWGKGGPFLFGRFSVADAMYAPVVFRFLAYGVPVDPVSGAYMKTVESMPASREWVAAARAEKAVIPAYEKTASK